MSLQKYDKLKRVILGIGNPLLDISAQIELEFLDRYGLKMANQILAEEKHLPMYKELQQKPDCQYSAGGATQNSIRVAQWMLQVPNATSYIGCIGKDSEGEKLKEAAKKDGVNAHYMIDEAEATGTCAVCIMDSERSLVANLAAANNYKIHHMEKEENFNLVKDAKVIYIAGFFITVSPETIKLVSETASNENKIFCMNLSAQFIMQAPPFKKVLMETLPYIDFLFGNETEAKTFAESEEWKIDDISEIALKIAALPKINKARNRTVVITQGSEATIVASNGEFKLYPVIKLPKEKLVDTNGAGDAFVGGFLSQLACDKHIDDCIRAGTYAANVIIQRSGCTFPEKPEFE